jgi:hypothetical protein
MVSIGTGGHFFGAGDGVAVSGRRFGSDGVMSPDPVVSAVASARRML